jgi:hypothetical protein
MPVLPAVMMMSLLSLLPLLLLLLQAILLRDACLSEVYAYEVLERSARA